MIDARWGVYPYEAYRRGKTCLRADRGMVWAKAGDHANRMKAAGSRSVVIRSSSRGPWCIASMSPFFSKFNLLVLSCPTQRSFAGGIALIKIAFEACRRRLGFYAYEGPLVSRFRSSYAHFACVSSVRRQKRSMDARMSPADFVQRNGLGAAFLILI